jgi:hypothetical protein
MLHAREDGTRRREVSSNRPSGTSSDPRPAPILQMVSGKRNHRERGGVFRDAIQFRTRSSSRTGRWTRRTVVLLGRNQLENVLSGASLHRARASDAAIAAN